MKPADRVRFEIGKVGSTYPGGKGSVYQKLINLMPPHETYIEAFLGGGAVMRWKRPAALNIGVDLDLDVIVEWQQWSAAASADPAATAAAVQSGDSRRRSPEPSNLATLPAKSLKGATADPAVKNAGVRSRFSSVAISDDGARFEFMRRDAIAWLRDFRFAGNELVYCDPPYLHETRCRADLYSHELSKEQHAELLLVLLKLPCLVMVSGYPSDMYSLALRRWNTLQYQAMTRRGLATEQIWFNFPAPTELHDYRYLGNDKRERERIRRKQQRWTARLARMDRLERQALLAAIAAVDSHPFSVAIKNSGRVLPQ